MLRIGITGGIGTGKSFVSKIFKSMGIPFYDADKEAKNIMSKSDIVRRGLINAFGAKSYNRDGALNRKWLADKVFKDPEKLQILNSIVHPVVIQNSKDWADKQRGAYSLKEAALLYESGSYKSLDYTILIAAPLDLRIKRVMKRDEISEEEVLDRMSKQMSEEEKEKYADFIIINDEIVPLLSQVLDIHHIFLKK
ncbi:dephospho-CoA kinase [Sphingobacterium alkalisoli]|uniref:Dephospho-CoA kinase n=1 Tax=Sphingobacterium alkalisoli TaxID=1874115 RepID=A0A4U0H534_9SPHI|nr:dephospho-CoA kinase [Sphingobacterium alkalisoli]TJY66847.1 dephospho-CoA kinase [Sphingobacterium alkalisoli]GGH13855.1 dephospho-CoA kinase [Sphingobacterium alkalisoli]